MPEDAFFDLEEYLNEGFSVLTTLDQSIIIRRAMYTLYSDLLNGTHMQVNCTSQTQVFTGTCLISNNYNIVVAASIKLQLLLLISYHCYYASRLGKASF